MTNLVWCKIELETKNGPIRYVEYDYDPGYETEAGTLAAKWELNRRAALKEKEA